MTSRGAAQTATGGKVQAVHSMQAPTRSHGSNGQKGSMGTSGPGPGGATTSSMVCGSPENRLARVGSTA